MPLRLLAPRYWPTWLGLAVMRLIVLLPYPVLVGLGRLLGRAVRHLPARQTRTARRNIELCLPELPQSERERIFRLHFENLGIALFETAIAWWWSDKRILSLGHVEGLEHLEAALARGKGVLVLSAHFTTIEIGARMLTASRRINCMYRPANNAALDYVLSRITARHVNRAIPRDDARTLVTSLRNGEGVWYAPDQAYRRRGAEMVRLFGIPAATNTATSRLARMTGAAVLPYFVERLPGTQGYRGVISPPLEDFPSDSPAADTERFNHLIEAEVRRIPEQYLWIHRRFKGLTDDYPDYYARHLPGKA